MPLSVTERKQLIQELEHLQAEVPGVVVRVDMATEALGTAQARVDEIERILSTGSAVRTPPADLE